MTADNSQVVNKITPVIVCGDSGTRLWPLSRAGFPKQFLVLSDTSSLFQRIVEPINSIAADDISVGEALMVSAEVNSDNKVTFLSENQFIYTPLAEVHRQANPGVIPPKIIEVQSGSYLVKMTARGLKTPTDGHIGKRTTISTMNGAQL